MRISVQKEGDKMARPAKSARVKTGTITKEEEAQRLELEDKLRGKNDKLVPPLYLTESQMEIFNYIMAELQEADILGNLDLFILAQTAIAVDRLQELDRQANQDKSRLFENAFRQARAEASKEYFRCCNELCLSPQSRAKLSIAKIKPGEKKKTIMDLINEDDEDEG
jgi:P27 family predicted phage terminase small subunit